MTESNINLFRKKPRTEEIDILQVNYTEMMTIVDTNGGSAAFGTPEMWSNSLQIREEFVNIMLPEYNPGKEHYVKDKSKTEEAVKIIEKFNIDKLREHERSGNDKNQAKLHAFIASVASGANEIQER